MFSNMQKILVNEFKGINKKEKCNMCGQNVKEMEEHLENECV